MCAPIPCPKQQLIGGGGLSLPKIPSEPEFERLQGILSSMRAAIGSRLWRSEESSRRSRTSWHRIATTFPTLMAKYRD
jgi:hypothetical protein